MDDLVKKRIQEKNQKIINMVIERAKRDFPDDIAIIGLTGSFNTNDFHEKSDLDLIIINNTDRGWKISSCFILDDVGYDIYCTPWDTRITEQANLESPMVSCLVDLKILYHAKQEDLDRFNSFRQKALDELAKPIGKDCLIRAEKTLSLAKQEYANMLLAEDLNSVRYASANILNHLINSLTSMNNTYIKKGVKRYLEILAAYQYLPDNFEEQYFSVIKAEKVLEIRQASLELLKNVSTLYEDMGRRFLKVRKPDKENLEATYEELWCNCRNKVINSVETNDISYAFHSARSAQDFLDEMREEVCGTKKYEVMKHFDSRHLVKFQEEFMIIMDDYLKEYKKAGMVVKKYSSCEELYNEYMN